MTLGDALGLSDDQERLLTRGLQAALATLSGYGSRPATGESPSTPSRRWR